MKRKLQILALKLRNCTFVGPNYRKIFVECFYGIITDSFSSSSVGLEVANEGYKAQAVLVEIEFTHGPSRGNSEEFRYIH